MNNRLSIQKGFSLLAAIFLLVILTGLSIFLVSIATMNQIGSALDIQGSRAYQSARSGIEWAAYQALTPAVAPACPATTLTFTGTTLQDFSTVVTCALSAVDEQGTTINIYQFTATACNQATCPSGSPGQGYIERQLTIVVGR
jgi:MSHA biogenesis protein MshP